MRISTLIRDPTELPSPFPQVRTEQKLTLYAPGTWSSLDTEPVTFLPETFSFQNCERIISLVREATQSMVFFIAAERNKDRDEGEYFQ